MGILDAPPLASASKLALPAPGVRVYNPKALAPFSAALSDALNALVVINAFGDSISFGAGSDGSPTASTGSAVEATYRSAGWIGQLQKLLAPVYGDLGTGAIMTTDPRVTLASATATATNGPQETGITHANASQSSTWTIDTPCTQIDVFWWDGGKGQWTWSVDSGASTGTAAVGSNNGATNTAYNKTSITGLANTTHSLTITGTALGSNVIAVVVPIARTAGVLVNRYARSGNTSGNLVGNNSTFTGNATGAARMIQAGLRCPAPDLAIVALGVNDFGNQNTTDVTTQQKPGTTPAGYAANLQTFITAAAARSIPVLLYGEPRVPVANYPAPATNAEQSYYDQAKALALSNSNTAYVDLVDLWGSQSVGNTRGFYTPGSVHPTRRGHGSMARLMHRVLTAPYGENAA